MTTATVRRHIDIEVTLDDNRVIHIPYHGGDALDTMLTDVRSDGKIVVSYMAVDDSCCTDDPIAERDGEVELIKFDDGYERNAWIETNLQACEHCEGRPEDHDDDYCERGFTPTKWPALFASNHAHWVERYEHGQVRYALTGESSQVDRQWDVASACAVLLLDDEWVGDLTEIARSILDEYTSWCNGDVWGVCHIVVDADTDEVELDETCWGFIGSEYAQQTLASEHADYMTTDTNTNQEGETT